MPFARQQISRRLATAIAITALASLALAASAAAEVRSGSATDPVESERLPAGQDIVAVSASYDTAAGTITAAVTTAGPPTTPETALLATFFPVNAEGECVSSEANILSVYGESDTAWGYNGSEGSGQKTVTGNTTTLTATSPVLVNRPFACMNAFVLDISDPEKPEPIEYLIPALKLTAPAPPPPAATTPPPPPSPPAPAPKVAKLALASPLKALTLRPGVWKKVKLRIANSGDATAAKVKLRIGGAKGIGIKPKARELELKAIPAGKSKTVGLRVLRTEKAKAVSTIPLTISGTKGLKVTAKLIVKAWHKKKRPPKTKEPTTGRGSLAEKIFYAYDSSDNTHSAYLVGYTFIDDTWAYNGIPSGGLPHCTEVTGTSKKEGCVKYSYEPKTGAVQFGSVTGAKVNSEGNFEIDGETYSPMSIPPAGARYQVEQYFIGFSGLCGLSFSGCTTWHEYITLTSDGRFVLTESSLSTSSSAAPVFVAVGSYPPDQEGTYSIEKGGRIHFAFADGTTKDKTIALFLNKEGKPDLASEGFILDSTYFTFAGTD